MKEDNFREEHQLVVDTPNQNIDYSATFHQVDKGNMIEVRYVLHQNSLSGF